MQQLAQFLAATGRRLRALGKVISHFFRKGKARPEARNQYPFSRRDRGVLRDRLEPAPMRCFEARFGGPFSTRHGRAGTVTALSLL